MSGPDIYALVISLLFIVLLHVKKIIQSDYQIQISLARLLACSLDLSVWPLENSAIEEVAEMSR